jgi:hypothetical protein
MDLKWLLLLLIVAQIHGEKVRYDGYKVFRVPIDNQEQLSVFEKFSNDSGVSHFDEFFRIDCRNLFISINFGAIQPSSATM